MPASNYFCSNSKSSKGPFIGGIVGGLFAAILFIALAFFLLRRRRRRLMEDDMRISVIMPETTTRAPSLLERGFSFRRRGSRPPTLPPLPFTSTGPVAQEPAVNPFTDSAAPVATGRAGNTSSWYNPSDAAAPPTPVRDPFADPTMSEVSPGSPGTEILTRGLPPQVSISSPSPPADQPGDPRPYSDGSLLPMQEPNRLSSMSAVSAMSGMSGASYDSHGNALAVSILFCLSVTLGLIVRSSVSMPCNREVLQLYMLELNMDTGT